MEVSTHTRVTTHVTTHAAFQQLRSFSCDEHLDDPRRNNCDLRRLYWTPGKPADLWTPGKKCSGLVLLHGSDRTVSPWTMTPLSLRVLQRTARQQSRMDAPRWAPEVESPSIIPVSFVSWEVLWPCAPWRMKFCCLGHVNEFGLPVTHLKYLGWARLCYSLKNKRKEGRVRETEEPQGFGTTRVSLVAHAYVYHGSAESEFSSALMPRARLTKEPLFGLLLITTVNGKSEDEWSSDFERCLW